MACDMLELAVPAVRDLNPYLPGKPVEELAREQGLDPETVVKLASNENPLGPSTHAVMAIAESMSELSRYPDANGFTLKRELAAYLAISEDQLTLGNGSNDLLVLLAEAFLTPDASAIYSEFGFVVYPLAVKATGAESIQVPSADWGHDLPAMAAAIKDNTRLIFLANPNNPTGTRFSKQAFTDFMAQVPEQVLVVLDEAYIEYNSGDNLLDGVKLLSDYPNLVVSRTFSKAFGLAGARIGYTISSASVADILNRLRQPFNTNIPAQMAAVATLQDEDYLQDAVELNRAGMDQLEHGFQTLGLDWIPSAGNFITVDFQQNAMPIYQAMLAEGVIVRPLTNYGMPNHLRISIGLPDENERCLAVLEKVLAKPLEKTS